MTDIHNTVVVWGPQASGKTTNAMVLAERLGCRGIIDDWGYDRRPAIQPGVLHLCTSDVEPDLPSDSETPVTVLNIEEALRRINVQVRRIDPTPGDDDDEEVQQVVIPIRIGGLHSIELSAQAYRQRNEDGDAATGDLLAASTMSAIASGMSLDQLLATITQIYEPCEKMVDRIANMPEEDPEGQPQRQH